MPFKINDDGTFTLTGVDHTGMADNTANIQSAINSIFDNYGGGYLWLPRPGNYQSIRAPRRLPMLSRCRTMFPSSSVTATFGVVHPRFTRVEPMAR